MDFNQVRRFCPDGHKYQIAPTFEPCCPLAHPGRQERRNPQQRARELKWARKRNENKNTWPRIRAFVRLRDKNQCRYCGARGAEADHVEPRSNKKDSDAFDNLVWSCHRCNTRKGRERGFTMKKNRLTWHGRLVSPEGIFGETLMLEVEAQRLARQVADGLTGMVRYKTERRGAS